MAHAKYIDKTPPNKRPDRIKETRRPSKKAKSDSKASGGKKVSRKPTDLNEEKAIRSGRGKSARDTKGSLGGDAERGLRGLAPKQKKMLAGIEAGNYTPGSARSVVQTLVRQAKIAMGKAERMREYSGGEGAAEQDRKALDALAAAQHLNGKYKLGYPVPKN